MPLKNHFIALGIVCWEELPAFLQDARFKNIPRRNQAGRKSFSNEKRPKVGDYSFTVCGRQANAINTATRDVQVVVGL